MKFLSSKTIQIVLALLATGLVLLLLIIGCVNESSAPYRYSSLSDLPSTRVAIIFGAEVYRNGDLSAILKDRVDGGVALYKAGKVKKLLMSGDNHTPDYNEVVNMQAYALKQGIPKTDIILDYAGLDTYDSCYRAHNIFGIQSAILVTQQYHAPRAVFICRQVGIQAVAYALPDFSKYPDLRVKYSLREYLADIKAWWQTEITHPQAAIMGKQEPTV